MSGATSVCGRRRLGRCATPAWAGRACSASPAAAEPRTVAYTHRVSRSPMRMHDSQGRYSRWLSQTPRKSLIMNLWVLTSEERGDPGAAARGRRVTPSGEQTASVLGRPSGVRGTGPVTVPGWPTASDRHPRHDLAVARGPGIATLDPAPPAPNRRPRHRPRTTPTDPATGRGELFLGIPTDPRRTRRLSSCS
jgi:hypothetical protein